MQSSLPISRLVSTTVNLAPSGAQMQNLSNLLILGSSDIINVVERKRDYSNITAVGNDFGTSAPEYLAAALWFEQVPQPTKVSIGRWAKTATSGKLIGATLTAAQQTLSNWTAITNGGVDLTIDGTAKNLATLNFSAVTSLNGVASDITTALAGAGTCKWDSVYSRFSVESSTTGATSTVSFATAGTGTDISAMLGLTVASSGAYTAAGIAAETALAAATLFDNQFGQQWYGLHITGAADTDHTAVGGFIEAATNKHIYGATNQDAATLNAGDTTNLSYLIQQLGYNRTLTQYSSTNPYAVVSAMARIMTTNYNANNSTITLMYKQEPGIVPETLTETQVNALESYNCNVFLAYNNNTAIFEQGVMGSGIFVDVITGVDWFALDLQTTLFNVQYTSPTKIPQTDAGVHTLVTATEGVCSQGVQNGLLGPGTWTVAGFGSLNQGDYMPKGFYVYAAPIASQATADRAARKSPPIQVAAKLAGAIHDINVIINVNQ